MANRNTLHIDHFKDFRNWLLKDGWHWEMTRGDYEVLRARKGDRRLIVYRKGEMKQHLSVQDKDIEIIRAFLKSKKAVE